MATTQLAKENHHGIPRTENNNSDMKNHLIKTKKQSMDISIRRNYTRNKGNCRGMMTNTTLHMIR